MANFEGYERRIAKIEKCLAEYGFKTLDETKAYTKDAGINVEEIVRAIQPIAFENAVWAYTLGCAIALKKGCSKAADAAEAIGIGLQAFCIPGSVADQRLVGVGHGNLAAMLLREETNCFCFLAGHESFAAAEGAIGIAKTANKVRKKTFAGYFKRSWERCGTDHLPYQRLYPCGDQLRLLHLRPFRCF